MKKNQKGFSVVEVLVALVVVGLLGTVGWLVYNRQGKEEPKVSTPLVQYVDTTDSSNSFSYSYPENWHIKPYVWEPCCHDLTEEQLKEPDWSKVSKPITLYPSGNEDVTITLNMDTYGDYWKSYEDLKSMVKEDYFAKILFEGQREDGHEALFTRVDYLGPPDAKVESFTDHRYYFDYAGSVLRVEFREKFHHDWPDDDVRPDINNTQFLSDFEHIAKSITFSN